jgi:hypothetical protein
MAQALLDKVMPRKEIAMARNSSVGVGYSGNATHDNNVQAAELTRQNAVVAAGNSQPAINAAAIAFHRAVIKSGLANGAGVEPSMSALRALGLATWQ